MNSEIHLKLMDGDCAYDLHRLEGRQNVSTRVDQVTCELCWDIILVFAKAIESFDLDGVLKDINAIEIGNTEREKSCQET